MKNKISKLYNLTITDIKQWLIENRYEYQKLKSQEFPPFDSVLYFKYEQLSIFHRYYKFKNKCETALLELDAIRSLDFEELSKRTRTYEILGNQNLLMFETNYIRWDEQVSDDKIKIHAGLYTKRKPFGNILCFRQAFRLLYWDYCVDEAISAEKGKAQIRIKLKRILGGRINFDPQDLIAAAIDLDMIKKGLKSKHKDFEDALQIISDYSIEKINCIVTRNIKDFKDAEIPDLIPDELIVEI